MYTSYFQDFPEFYLTHKLAITCLCLLEAYFCCIATAKVMCCFFPFLIHGIFAIRFVNLVLIGNDVLLNLKGENTFDLQSMINNQHIYDIYIYIILYILYIRTLSISSVTSVLHSCTKFTRISSMYTAIFASTGMRWDLWSKSVSKAGDLCIKLMSLEKLLQQDRLEFCNHGFQVSLGISRGAIQFAVLSCFVCVNMCT